MISLSKKAVAAPHAGRDNNPIRFSPELHCMVRCVLHVLHSFSSAFLEFPVPMRRLRRSPW